MTRAIPHNLEAEKSVLGAMTLTLDAAGEAMQALNAEDFLKLEHREIFDALVELYAVGQLGDAVSLVECLTKRGRLEQAGNVTYVSEIIAFVATGAHLEYHLQIVKEKSTLRKLIDSATQIVTDSFKPESNISDLLNLAEKKIFEIAQTKIHRDFVPIKDLIKSSIEKAEELFNLKDQLTGIPSGFDDLDNKTSGFQTSDLIVLAARPSMGKTALALNFVEHASVQLGHTSAVFSLEMSKEQIVFRLLCSNAQVSYQKLRSGFASKEDFTHLANAASRLAEAPIYIDDTPGITLMELRGKARRLKAKTDCKLFMIDYLQLMTSGQRRAEGRQQEISDISRSLKELARELDCPVVILSQLNRAVESRNDRRPVLSDLRESGAIEQDADIVMLLTRKEYYNADDEPGMADLIIAKQRNGPVGDIKLYFNKEFAKFGNLSFASEDYVPVSEPSDVFV